MRDDPGGEDRFVKFQQTIRRDQLAQLQIDAMQIQHAPVVAQRFVKLLFAGDLFGDIKLPANLLRASNRVTEWPRACIDNKGQAGGASSLATAALWRSAGITGIRVSWQARGLTRQEVTLPAKI